jgi:hypothetical protein
MLDGEKVSLDQAVEEGNEEAVALGLPAVGRV